MMFEKAVYIVAIYAFSCIFANTKLFAVVEGDAPDPIKWSARLDNPWGTEGVFPVNVVIVEKLQPNADVFPLPVNELLFNRYGFLKVNARADLTWSFKLNRFERRQKPPKDRFVKTFSVLSRLGGADIIVHAPKKGRAWSLLTLEDGKVTRTTKDFTYPKTDAPNIYRWLFEVFGYNGIVLDQEKGWLLIGSAVNLFRPGDQAVIYLNSRKSHLLQSENGKGSAIVECARTKLGYGVFKVILKRTELKVGDKVIIVPD